MRFLLAATTFVALVFACGKASAQEAGRKPSSKTLNSFNVAHVWPECVKSYGVYQFPNGRKLSVSSGWLQVMDAALHPRKGCIRTGVKARTLRKVEGLGHWQAEAWIFGWGDNPNGAGLAAFICDPLTLDIVSTKYGTRNKFLGGLEAYTCQTYSPSDTKTIIAALGRARNA